MSVERIACSVQLVASVLLISPVKILFRCAEEMQAEGEDTGRHLIPYTLIQHTATS